VLLNGELLIILELFELFVLNLEAIDLICQILNEFCIAFDLLSVCLPIAFSQVLHLNQLLIIEVLSILNNSCQFADFILRIDTSLL
jgi:hypothetical protein